ncbi:MAG TPA: biotin/lipoyl-binding protein, partial [Lacipirellulaceae bacterium]|nr:biotin/lipoyl-binding protein [Lacipirellulaceae bacterium]
MMRALLLPIFAASSLSYTVWHVTRSSQPVPPLEPPVQPARAPYNDVVAGVGLVEPRSENVEVAAVVPGTVVDVAVRVGDAVEPDAVLFRLDDRRQRAELAVAQSRLVEAEAALQRWRQMPRVEDLPPSEARVQRYRADLELRSDQLQRARRLAAQGVITEQELVEREQAYSATQAELTQAEAEHARLLAGAWEADLAVAEAQAAMARELVEQAEVELDRLVVRAPIRGTVLKVDVRRGEYVGT